jgi:HD-GYP domain-containing protein (c-di-GMP phosphodiesterase class II)
MTHDRPHRPASSLDDALEALKDEAGRQFDPRVVEAALAMPSARWKELLD